MNDLVAGAWRNGLDENTSTFVASVEKRQKAGFRLLPYESTVAELIDLLDGYDVLCEQLLTEEEQEPAPAAKRAKAA